MIVPTAISSAQREAMMSEMANFSPINEKSLRSPLGWCANGMRVSPENATSQALMHCGKAIREGVVVFSDSALYGEIFQTQCFTTSP